MFLDGRRFRPELLFSILLLTCETFVIVRWKLENNDRPLGSWPVRLVGWRSQFDSYLRPDSCEPVELSKWLRCRLRSAAGDASSLTFAPIGRTGNRMYQYASTIGMAVRRRMWPLLPPNAGLDQCFRVSNEYDPTDRNTGFVESHPADLFYSDDWLREAWNGSVRLNSLMQSWKYFGHVDEMLRGAFVFKRNAVASAERFLRSGSRPPDADVRDYVYVSVHVRRTDFVDTYGSLIKPMPLAYARQAMSLFRRLYRQLVRFVIVSDDPDWCRRNLNVTGSDLLSEGRHACDDLAILARCNHSIITAGSSFGWWGAFLANGQVTYYPGWLKSGSWYNLKYVESDFFLPRWKKLDF